VKKDCNLYKFKYQKEKEQGENDLKAYSDQLKGVDELRMAAEAMSREIKRRDKKELLYPLIFK